MIKENIQIENQFGVNRAVKTVVAVLGVIFGFGGMGHGFFEALQGNNPTGGLLIEAIGAADRFWSHGTEPAFTVIPNFLLSGIAAMLAGAAVIVWSAGFLHKKHASLVFLLLFILSFAVGGGIAQIIFFLLGWAMSTRIRKPLTWWNKALPAGLSRRLSALWLPFLIISALLILCTLQIAIFGFVPGMSDPDSISLVMVVTLGGGLLFLLLAFVSGCAHDLEERRTVHE